MEDLISRMRSHVDFQQRHSWIHRLYPLFGEYKKLDVASRKQLVKHAKYIADVTPTTLQRSFSAFSFLEKLQFNVLELQEGVTLMGLEAAAKAIAVDESKGKELLELVIERQLTSRQADAYFRDVLSNVQTDYQDPVSQLGRPLLRRGGVPAERGALASTSGLSNELPKFSSSIRTPEFSAVAAKRIETNLGNTTKLKYRDAFQWMAQSVYSAREGPIGTSIVRAKDKTQLRNDDTGEFNSLAAIKEHNTLLSSLYYIDTQMHASRSSHFQFLSLATQKLLENQQVFVIFRTIPSYLQTPIKNIRAARPSNFFVLEKEIVFNTEPDD